MISQETQWLLEEKYNHQESEAFLDDCARLETGEPLGYVIGYVPFLNCHIWLDSKPLIPRPETEFWTEQAIGAIREYQEKQARPVHVLDLCAGSGAIGCAIAKAIPQVIVTLAELDPAHLPTIQKNLIENNLAGTTEHGIDRHSVIASDLFTQVPGVFDFILTNPPYIDAAADTVEASVTAHEPHLALFGGNKGMAVIAQIISQATAHLNESGQLWIEHEPFQCEAIATLAAKAGFVCTHHHDQYHTVRYSILSWPVAV